MVPNIIHFIFGLKPDFGGKPFSLVHYLAVKSAAEIHKPDQIFLHYQYKPSGAWWEKAEPYLTLKYVEPPSEIFGNPLVHIAHKSDIIRINVLREIGGIYLDMDTISIKPLQDFFNVKFAMGLEIKPPVFYTFWDKLKKSIRTISILPWSGNSTYSGLCNAVMIAEPNAKFLNIWLETYRSFRSKGKDEFWVEHSVKIPWQLSNQHPDLITILSPYFFHYPLYDPKGLQWLFEKDTVFENAYLHHLWETESWHKYLSVLTADGIKKNDTTFNRIARKYV